MKESFSYTETVRYLEQFILHFWALVFLIWSGIIIFILSISLFWYQNFYLKQKARATLSQAFLSILSEADEIIMVNAHLKVIYAKHLPELLDQDFDFEQIVCEQFIDHDQALSKCRKALFNGNYFEDVFRTAQTDDVENFIWLRILPLYTYNRKIPSHRAIIMSDITLHNANMGYPTEKSEISKNLDSDPPSLTSKDFEKTFFEGCPFGVIQVNSFGGIRLANSAACQLLTRSDLIGSNIESALSISMSQIRRLQKTQQTLSIPLAGKKSQTSNQASNLVSPEAETSDLFTSSASSKAATSSILLYVAKDLPSSQGSIQEFTTMFLFETPENLSDFSTLSQEAQASASEKRFASQPSSPNLLSTPSGELGDQFKAQIQAQKIQAVGQLAGGIAHDFNNLLTAMIGFCDLILQRVLPNDPSYMDILQIKQNANRASTLVKQLLAFSRQQSLQPRVIRLKSLSSGLSSLLKRLLGAQINFSVSCDKKIWSVKADVSQLEQVIINLAVNARDAMDGHGDLTLMLSNLSNKTKKNLKTFDNEILYPGDYVVIQMRDTGCGIPKENFPVIFEPFFSTKETGKGTGLGLATVYGIIKQTGGLIEVESEVGQGATFRIYLPRCKEPPSASEEKAAPVTNITGSETILLVEDEDAVRIFAERALQDKGYHVISASNGEDALSFIEQGHFPDILVTDIAMPKMSGPALQKKLQERNLMIPIIFTSGYTEEAFRQNLSQDQTIHFLPKPFTIRDLAKKIREALSIKENQKVSSHELKRFVTDNKS